MQACGFHSPYEAAAWAVLSSESASSRRHGCAPRSSAALRSRDPDEAVREVQEVKGLGPFVAELVVIRGANAPDALPRHSAVWRPFRTWAAVHLRALREQR